jgi:glycosyltransferase involved in cell wall biosynthesis
LDLCQSLAKSFDVTVLAPSAVGASSTERIGDVTVVRFRYAPLKRWERLAAPGAILPNIRQQPLLALLVPLLVLSQCWSLARAIRRENFDVIHCNWIIPQGFAFAVLNHLMRTPPSLLTCLGGDVYVLNRWPLSRIKTWILNRFDRIAVISVDIGRELSRIAGNSPLPPVRHIPMGVDLARFDSAYKTQRPDGDRELLFVGRLAEKKGLEVLLTALQDPRLCSRAGFRLTVVGDGPLRRELEAQAADAGLAEKVTFLGALPHDALARQLRSADVLCAPFVVGKDGDREGMPAVVMEAAATGLPIIASDIGGVRDIVETGVSGWLLPAGDASALAAAIVDSLNNPYKCAEMGRRAAERAKSYSWEAIANMYSEELHRAIAMRRGGTDSGLGRSKAAEEDQRLAGTH